MVPPPTFQVGHNVTPCSLGICISLPWETQQGREEITLHHVSHPTAKGLPGGGRTIPWLTRLFVFSEGVIHQGEKHHSRCFWGLCVFKEVALLKIFLLFFTHVDFGKWDSLLFKVFGGFFQRLNSDRRKEKVRNSATRHHFS